MAKRSYATTEHLNGKPPVPLPVGQLHFDHQNPRLVETTLDQDANDQSIIRVLWKEMAVEELALSIAANGYFQHEPLFAIEESANDYTVIEGNRRLAAVKILLDKHLQKFLGATDLPQLSSRQLDQLKLLPVIITTRRAVWQYIGFKHVNGPRPWGAWSKAQYISRVHADGVALEDISKLIGDTHSTVRRLYRGLMVLEQANNQQVWSLNDRWNKRLFFSHLYTGLSYPGFQLFLGLKEDASYKPNPVPRKCVSNLGDLCVWLFGSKSKAKPPIIKSQNPDLKKLDDALLTDRGRDALLSGLPLEVSFDASLGDDRVFRESLLDAKLSLQKAFGAVHTGYDGTSDLYEVAEDTYKLSGRLLDAMDDIRSPVAKRGQRGERRK